MYLYKNNSKAEFQDICKSEQTIYKQKCGQNRIYTEDVGSSSLSTPTIKPLSERISGFIFWNFRLCRGLRGIKFQKRIIWREF